MARLAASRFTPAHVQEIALGQPMPDVRDRLSARLSEILEGMDKTQAIRYVFAQIAEDDCALIVRQAERGL